MKLGKAKNSWRGNGGGEGGDGSDEWYLEGMLDSLSVACVDISQRTYLGLRSGKREAIAKRF